MRKLLLILFLLSFVLAGCGLMYSVEYEDREVCSGTVADLGIEPLTGTDENGDAIYGLDHSFITIDSGEGKEMWYDYDINPPEDMPSALKSKYGRAVPFSSITTGDNVKIVYFQKYEKPGLLGSLFERVTMYIGNMNANINGEKRLTEWKTFVIKVNKDGN